MNALNGRCDRNVGLKSLVIQSCRVHKVEYVSELLELVKEVNWGNIEVMGSNYEGSDDYTDADESDDESEEQHCPGCRC